MAEDIAISVNDVSKMYKLYDNPMDRLKESLGLSKKKKYKEHFALDHVSFQVNKGETVGIIGTNGSGKSTILKIITGDAFSYWWKCDGKWQDIGSSGAGSRL